MSAVDFRHFYAHHVMATGETYRFPCQCSILSTQSSFSNTLSTLLTGLWATGLIFPLDFGTAVFFICLHVYVISRVWRSERGNYNPSIEDGQTTQWPKEKGQRTNNDLQNTTQKTKDRVTRTPLKTGSKLKCSERVSSSCSTSGTCFGF